MPHQSFIKTKKQSKMDRRNALKNLSLSLGYTVAVPTIFNMLSSCTAEAEGWKPLFLSSEEKHMVTHLADIILPKTDTPGALDVNVPQFIDVMYHDIEQPHRQERFKKGAALFAKAFKSQFSTKASKGNKAQFETQLASYFNLSAEATAAVLQQHYNTEDEIAPAETDDYLLYNFLLSIKEYTMFGYLTSEKVGEEVLNYDPIPGELIGCISVEDLPNGRAWSL